MKRSRFVFGLTALLLTTSTAPAVAYEGIVEKRVFSLDSYTTVGGERIDDVKLGYETYGTLSPERDNVILVTQPGALSSHAAGRYRETDPRPGYWDSIIGTGQAIDTDRFFVVSMDTPANVNVDDPDVITTGPASIDPETGEPYGMRFPLVTIRDFVELQKALLDSLGIERLHAVVGASMGAMQALEWATAYPGRMDRVVAVAGTARVDAWLIGWYHVRTAPIRRDPNWHNGDYYGQEPPIDGLTTALEIGLLQAYHPSWASRNFSRRWADEDEDPAAAFENRFAIEEWLEETARERARRTDANSALYLLKAVQLFVAGQGESLEEGLSRVEADVLLVPMASDQQMFPKYFRRAAKILRSQEKSVDYIEVEGDAGHADDVLSIEQIEDDLRRFLGD